MSIIAELPGFLQVFSDGSVKRFNPEVSPASLEFAGGYKSKDLVIDPSKPVTARLFLPCTQDPTQPLPVLVYFHGGGFCIGSTTWSGFHNFLGGLCARAQALIVSVDYRLAPEHRLPVAYQDCYSSIKWLSSNARDEPWLARADISRVFLAGESAGGNIVHNVMLCVAQHEIDGINIKGLLIVHPFFGSEGKIESELADGVAEAVDMSDVFWRLSLPEQSDRDHFACNFEKAKVLDGEWQHFPAVGVFLAGLDLLKDRGRMYAEFLKGKGVKVKVEVAEEQPHAYHVFYPNSHATHLLQSQMVEFMDNL